MSINKVFEERRYQERAVEAFKDWSSVPVEKEKIATILLPTGTGKMYIGVKAISTLPTKTKILWCAHRRELIDQAVATFQTMSPEKNIQAEIAERKATPEADVVVASVQTFVRQRKNIIGFTPEYIVVDEWHHYAEKNIQYQSLFDKFPNAKVLGLTATGFRFGGGELPLGRKLIEMDIGTAVRHNYLVPPKPETLQSNVSLAGVHKRAGDFVTEELSAAVNVEARNKLIAKRLIQAVREEKRQGILFSVDVAHSKAMYQLIKNEVRCAEIYGETDKEERSDLIEKIRNREIDIITNNNCLIEGFDAPHLSFVCIAKPTLSLGYFIQAAGRGLRKSEGKTDCLVIDVFDKVKITQARITYSDLAKAGDIDGSNKRIDSILKEPIANVLKNFPIMMRLEDQERLTIDNESWFTPSWIVGENQWVISWTKSEERILIEKEYELKLLLYPPNVWNLRKNHMQVHHRFFGAGEAFDIDPTGKMMINFEDGIGIKAIEFNEISKREPKYEKKKLDKPIKRVFYICIKKNGGRLISMLQENKTNYKIIEDIRGDKTTINEFISATATDDDMMQIVKTEAKWRDKPASTKQKEFIERLIQQKKTADDIDLTAFSAGDASVIIDQVMWHENINNLFGAVNQKELIGYNNMNDDV